ncbi:MAG TPA: hypothetical protein ENO36_01035 [Fervidicoccus fontis]|uniref:Uncharacterized protein n=1 Tax=Fervidicoccus fontis TaxID=683846 RepID=A0A7C2UKN9_9CREN|nr:MAG: hypothetical protein C0179_01380 [Fervidicoccus sp.]HEU97429.1 hypothetical protein [Fervidicoccus fontis]
MLLFIFANRDATLMEERNPEVLARCAWEKGGSFIEKDVAMMESFNRRLGAISFEWSDLLNTKNSLEHH